MKEVIQNPPMVTYRRPPNLRDKLIRSRIPDPPKMRPKITISIRWPPLQRRGPNMLLQTSISRYAP